MGSLELTLETDRASYYSGERPEFRVALRNVSDRPLHVVGCIDGSWADGARYPKYTFSVERNGGPPDHEDWSECGTRDPLRLEDIRRLMAGEALDPFGPGFRSSPWLEHLLFDVPGTYAVRLTYEADAPPDRFLAGFDAPATVLARLGEVERVRAASPTVTFVVHGPGPSPGSRAPASVDDGLFLR